MVALVIFELVYPHQCTSHILKKTTVSGPILNASFINAVLLGVMTLEHLWPWVFTFYTSRTKSRLKWSRYSDKYCMYAPQPFTFIAANCTNEYTLRCLHMAACSCIKKVKYIRYAMTLYMHECKGTHEKQQRKVRHICRCHVYSPTLTIKHAWLLSLCSHTSCMQMLCQAPPKLWMNECQKMRAYTYPDAEWVGRPA